MFETLSQRFSTIFRRLRGEGVVREEHLDAALAEIRTALLEADVSVGVVDRIVAAVREKALGSEVLEGLQPAQQVIRIVHGEIQAALGGRSSDLHLPYERLAPVLLVGLQGSGKTTTAGKIARRLRERGRRPFLVSTDVRRPAAREQLAVLAREIGVPCLEDAGDDPFALALAARRAAVAKFCDVLIVDTAGRLHVDPELMAELKRLHADVRPEETLFVADAMTGQDAVRSAEAFAAAIPLSGIVLTKLDGDARGGAALSVRGATGKPIKLVGVGEKTDAIEDFHPERMASRILGMGDVLTLIEKAEKAVGDGAARLRGKLRDGIDLDDFLEQLQSVRKMGSLRSLVEMIPGMGNRIPQDASMDEGRIRHVEAIVRSMTAAERRDWKLIDPSRKRRIARGSGRPVSEVNALLKQFSSMRKMMKRFGGAVPGATGRAPRGLPR